MLARLGATTVYALSVLWMSLDWVRIGSDDSNSLARSEPVTTKMSRREREQFLAELHVGVISIAEEGRAPLTVPIWYDYEPGGELWVITSPESRKGRLLERAGRFSLVAQTEDPPYQYVSVEGPVTSTELADVEAVGRPMARRYLGEEGGDAYIASTTSAGEPMGNVYRMRPERWLTVDYGKLYSDSADHAS